MYVAPDVLVVLSISNLQKITCVILRNLFCQTCQLGDGVNVNVNAFSHQFLAWRPLLLRGLSLVL